eukprot:CAMPEP_0183296250 /NCGR_PEP_ID=MMETSP0160_2-20130417/3890_1 /TAXON_ID=2839 ORGANISM="Odontella Sinensis, Strain Grunow 1884" /NCGR_SAMPLE_ID=MMETSP0160_2 /ASSEMBLY_ACC=CAM_ASM_000250 /LENGTH=293 /DNA_ID=CAMNT_0025457845 /DNA_START=43 /DNA_END=921 /DNA_ORIENTATION=+
MFPNIGLVSQDLNQVGADQAISILVKASLMNPCIDNDVDEMPAVLSMSEDEGYGMMSDDEDCSRSSEDVGAVEDEKFHELYLPEDCETYKQPIVYSDGMDAHECEEFHRRLDERDVARTKERTIPTRKRKSGDGYLFRNLKIRREGKILKFGGAPKPRDQDNELEDDELSARSSSSTMPSASSSSSLSASVRTSVSFSDSVTVFPVFSYEVYPSEIRENIWTGRKEVKEGKRRSKVEFKYDGSNWRAATEEEDMVQNPRTGLLEHPVHYFNEDFSPRDEVVNMCLVMPPIKTW